MKKIALTIGLLMASMSALADNTLYQKNAFKALIQAGGYSNIVILGQVKGYCTIAHSDFDWNAVSYSAVKNGKEEKGVVCNGHIYN